MPASIYIAASLDGYIARLNGNIDWLPTEKDVDGGDFGYQAFMDTVDTIVMGRRTYETVAGFGGEWPFAGKRVVVLSSQAAGKSRSTSVGEVEWAAGTPQAIMAQLEASGTRQVYIDGGITLQGFLQTGLVDRLIITRVPVLLGQGRPLFGLLQADMPLVHVRTTAFRNGLVQSEYRVRPQA